jgi:hypothetical protein
MNCNACEISKHKLFNIIIYLVVFIINYESIKRYLNSFEKKKEKKWNVWTEETKHEDKDPIKWYIIPGNITCRYKGEWKNGLANGRGIKEIYGTTDNDHSIMKGNFVDGYIDGYGTQTYDITKDEELFEPYYEGEFKSGYQHGKGIYYYGTGCYREGTLINGKFEGKGIYYCKKRNQTWVGNYVDDVRDLDSGEWRDGEWRNNEINI